MHTFILPNGLTLIFKERKGSPNVALSLRILAGSIYEAPGETGVAHFLEHIVFDGTEKYPSEQQLSLLIEEKGAIKNGLTNKETVEYIIKLLKEDLEAGFEYLSQIILHPLLRGEDIEREKKIISQEICRLKSDPKLFAPRLLPSLLYPNTPLEKLVTGEVTDLEKITRDLLAAYMQRLYHPANMVLVVVGDVGIEVIKELAQTHLGEPRAGKSVSPQGIESQTIARHVEVIPSLQQASLMLGFKGVTASDERRYALDVLSHILTRGRSSRLMRRLRGELGIVYGVNSYNHSSRNHGYFALSAGLSEQNVEQCFAIMRKEIQRVCEEPISTEELHKAFTAIKTNITFLFEDSQAETSFYSNAWCTSVVRTPEEELELYLEWTQNPSHLQSVAKEIFGKDPSVLLFSSKEV